MYDVAETHPDHSLVPTDESAPMDDMGKYLDVPLNETKEPINSDGSAGCITLEELRALLDSVDRTMRYQYRPLDISKSEIRLIAILPGSGHEEMECKMAHAPCFNRLDFEALSYTWGDATASPSINIDGQFFPVRQNLLDALLALRHKEKTRYLWIDAICIDQTNDSEKSQEVRRMG